MITEPCFNLPRIREAYDQVIFEEYGFNALYRATGKLAGYPSTKSLPTESHRPRAP